MLYPSPSSTVENVYCGRCVSWHGVTAFDSSAWTQPDANTTFIRWIFTQTQTHSQCSWYCPFFRCPSKYDFGELTPLSLSNGAVVPRGLEMGVLSSEWKKFQVGGYKVFALPFRFVVETSRKWQTNRVNVLSLAFSCTWILSPLNKGSQHTSSLCQVG